MAVGKKQYLLVYSLPSIAEVAKASPNLSGLCQICQVE